jgi:Holliday junction resolvase
VSSPSKIKGSGFEREVVEALKAGGLDAKKMPLSGALADYKGDVTVKIRDALHVIECKRRKAGFKTMYGWLGDNNYLVFRDDRCEPMIAMRLSDFIRLVKGE